MNLGESMTSEKATSFNAPMVWRVAAMIRFAVGVAVGGYVVMFETPPLADAAPSYLVPVGLTVAGGLIFLAAVQSFTTRQPTWLSTFLFLLADLLAPLLVLILFSFDPNNHLFVFLLVAMVQSAIALRLQGALIAWGALSFVYIVLAFAEEGLSGAPADPRVVVIRIALMLLVALLSERLTHHMDKGVLAGQRAVGMDMQDEMIERFVHSYEARDPERSGRIERIAKLTAGTAQMLGIPDGDAALMSRASKLHHIGDVAVPEEIWRKTSGLTPEEVEQVRRHSTIGAELLGQGDSPLLSMAEAIANFHHERWDGRGSLGRRGEGIPLGARIVSVADAFEAMTHDRPYRAARSRDEALNELESEAGKQFDPRVVEAFAAFVRG